MYRHLGDEAEPRFDVVRNYLRFFGPARIRDAAEFLDAPPKEVERRWPADVVEVRIGDVGDTSGRAATQPRFILAGDVDALTGAGPPPRPGALRLLGPYDAFLQLRDRDVLVPEPERRKALWPVIGRPGAVVAGGDVLALWRPRTSANRLRLAIEPWTRLTKGQRAALEEQAELLAAHRGATLAGLEIS
jgi:hypothetical protein